MPRSPIVILYDIALWTYRQMPTKPYIFSRNIKIEKENKGIEKANYT